MAAPVPGRPGRAGDRYLRPMGVKRVGYLFVENPVLGCTHGYRFREDGRT